MLRSIIPSLLLGATALTLATPAAAQDAPSRGWQAERGDRGNRGPRPDRVTQDNPADRPADPDFSRRGNRDFRGDGNGQPDRPRGGDDRPAPAIDASAQVQVAQRDGRYDGRSDGRDRRAPGGVRPDVRGDGRFDRTPDYRDDRRLDRRDDPRRDDRRYADGRYGDGRYDPRFQGNGRGWNDGWRNDRRYDWRGYRNGNRDRFVLPRYYAPRGYNYRRWSPGYRIDPFFYGRGYWIADPYDYRLPPVYGSYRWVRYYDDVLLVDRRGRVIAVNRDFFW